jgi:hypothetical protein
MIDFVSRALTLCIQRCLAHRTEAEEGPCFAPSVTLSAAPFNLLLSLLSTGDWTVLAALIFCPSEDFS